ncbi:MAG: hypothetical protein U0235_31490 [Polyangiaceae bacterium]
MPAAYLRVPRDGAESRFLPVKDMGELERRRPKSKRSPGLEPIRFFALMSSLDLLGGGQGAGEAPRRGPRVDRENASLGLESVVRPHPLVVLMSRDGLSVLVVPAIVWDRGHDMLAPFSEKLAQGSAMLVVLGHPTTADGRVTAMSKGVASIVSGGSEPRTKKFSSPSRERSSSSRRAPAPSRPGKSSIATASSSGASSTSRAR